MKLFLPLLSILVAATAYAGGGGSGHGKNGFELSQYKCKGIDAKIKKINSEMRKGYSNQEGERYREKLRELKSQRDKCKKRRYSVD